MKEKDSAADSRPARKKIRCKRLLTQSIIKVNASRKWSKITEKGDLLYFEKENTLRNSDDRKIGPHNNFIPNMLCMKAQRGKPTNCCLSRTGVAPHGAKCPHLRLIVYK